jgi:hypothetical protein
MLGPILERKSIWQHQPPASTEKEYQLEIERGRRLWGAYFQDVEQCDLFHMLPVSDNQRKTILQHMIEDSKFQQEIKDCKGAQDSSPKHRRFCIKCCTIKHPENAKPYY